MKALRKAASLVVLGGVSVAAWFGVNSLVQNVQFARASQEVEATRQQLQSIQDLSTVYRDVNKVVEPSVVKRCIRLTTHPNAIIGQISIPM